MRKIILSILTVFLCASISAQDELSFKNKNGHEVLPQKGDWSFGITAEPFIEFIGNAFNGSPYNPAPVFVSPDAPMIFNEISLLPYYSFVGKYAKSSNTLYRARLNFSLYNENQSQFVAKDMLIQNQMKPEFVEDKFRTNTSAVILSMGVEKRKGSNRLQGFYGVESILAYIGNKFTYNYGNPMNVDFVNPESFDFNGNVYNQNGRFYRMTSVSVGKEILIGARAFLGVEYFIIPKLSIGGELGYSAGFSNFGPTKIQSETFDFDNLTAEKVENKLKLNNGFSFLGMGIDRMNAGLNLNFYF